MRRGVRGFLVLLLVFLCGGTASEVGARDLWAVREPHVFSFRPGAGVGAVAVAGSFNGWSKEAHPLADADGDGVWEVAVPLDPGRYLYKFVLDGERWVPDPTAPVSEPDGYGGSNSVLVVAAEEGEDIASRRGDGSVHEASLGHPRDVRYAVRSGPFRVLLTLRLDRDDVEAVEARPRGGAAVPLRPFAVDGRYEYWLGEVPATPETFAYAFAVRDGDRTLEIDRHGLRREGAAAEPFVLPPGGVFETPAWARESVFYQIFPERFRNGDTANDPPWVKPWRYEPLPRSHAGWTAHYGGDFRGVAEKVDHLADLGVTAVWFNPVMVSRSNHKYDIVEYERAADDFGGDAAFDSMLETLHGRGIRAIIDGVFNHSSDQHAFFRDVAARGPESPHYAWYRVKRWPFPPGGFTPPEGPHPVTNYYEAWGGHSGMPEYDERNEGVRAYLLGVVERWLRRGIDGWRLDVAEGLSHDFWRLFRAVVKRIRPDAYLLGEIWTPGGAWLGGDEFDATMNYPFRGAVLEFVAEGRIDAAGLRDRVSRLLLDVPAPALAVQYNHLSSHDVPRFLDLSGGRRDVVRQAVAFQFSFPGAPAIYYGEEIGMAGGADPDNRRVFPWDEPEVWDRDLLAFYRRVIALRKQHPALRALPYYTLLASGRTYAAARVAAEADGGERAVVVFHAADAPAEGVEVPLDAAPLGLPDGTWEDLLGGGAFEARGGRLRLGTLPPRSSLWLVPRLSS